MQAEVHPDPNTWREDLHPVLPPVTARQNRPATVITPNRGSNRAGPAITPNHTTPVDNNTYDVVATRRQMDKFAHLRGPQEAVSMA